MKFLFAIMFELNSKMTRWLKINFYGFNPFTESFPYFTNIRVKQSPTPVHYGSFKTLSKTFDHFLVL